MAGMIHEVDPNPGDERPTDSPEELAAASDAPRAAKVVSWPAATPEGRESRGGLNELLYRLVLAAATLAGCQVEIQTGSDRFALCANCGARNPVGVRFRHRRNCVAAEIARLIQGLEAAGSLYANSERKEDASTGERSAGDGNRSRSTWREPWSMHSSAAGSFGVIDRDERKRATIVGADQFAIADRIVACVNFCAGYSTEFLRGERREES